MAALFCVGVIAALGPPVEVVIDCSSWTGAKVTQVRVQFESWDGKVVTDLFECADMTDPTCPRGALRIILRDAGWRFHYLDNYRILVRGSKDSPVLSVSFASDGWAPEFQYVPVRLTPIAPPPREKK
ncbi:MAG TPA: hypothetical protein VM529_10925 [Gemmata sp.]|jgi:hypothetical protein|nr:hypothetical protein [Gemmata sp.]